MKVLFDELGFAQTHGGVSRYFAEMIKRLPEDVEWRISVKTTKNVYLQEAPFNIPKMTRSVTDFASHIRPATLSRAFVRLCQATGRLLPADVAFDEANNRRESLRLIKEGCFDLLHVTDPHPRWNTWRSIAGCKPIVATVHDLIPEIFFPHDFMIRRMRRSLLNDAAHIIAVSENTKRDIVRLYGANPDKISVVYHGYLPVATPERIDFDLPERYVLYVGQRTYGKNYGLFRDVAIDLLKEDDNLELFFTGEPLDSDEQKPYRSAGVLGRVRQRFLSDSEMRYVFAHASVFVCPSRYEGFGIPILDSLSAGCPTVLSDASCLPEVGGNAALYFHVDDGTEMKHRIRQMLDDPSLATEMREAGIRRVREFSWERCANETAAIYRSVLGEK